MQNKSNFIYRYKEIYLGLFFAAIILAGIVWLARTTSEKNKISNQNQIKSSTLLLAESFYDFGTISMAAGKVSHKFNIENAGDESLKLKKMYTSCMCTQAFFKTDRSRRGPFGMPGHGVVPSLNETLEANQDAEIEVIFDPAAHGPSGVGPISRIVYLEDESGQVSQIRISAVVTP